MKWTSLPFSFIEFTDGNYIIIKDDNQHTEPKKTKESFTMPLPKEKKDNVNHPSHYTQGGVECIDALTAATVNLQGIEAVCTANAIKYLWRWKQKNGVEDLKKAKWYIDKLISEEEK